MASLEYFLVCSAVSIDRESNQISLFNVTEEIRPPRLPSLGIHLVAVSAWNADDPEETDDQQATLLVKRPDGSEVGRIPVNFTLEAPRHRVTHRIIGATFDVAGEWVFEILLNGEHQASHRITVHEPSASRD